MEKKERYHSVIDCNEDFVIRDCDSSRTCKSLFEVKTLLNYQNREINRLTKMLYTTTKHADKLNEENNKLNKIIKANIISADKVVEENKKLKEQLSKKEETHKHIMSGEYIPANIAEKSLKLSEQSQKQLAIEELEKMRKNLDIDTIHN